ncbi:RNA polymerase sigma factor [Leptospira idonii]|uniref:Sigma-70 family RNA polymerase sigma factor n=1 Tax=Leptospira idonii TaxID=1193500 RepID=A0A4R9M153_9LEPT|nr:sigma-70 family RNA polymerase sigma factor [Leptospira idonii]TGN19681.1 sigma-70 family RNA polymerase sigma factor [Leptospira idonii]
MGTESNDVSNFENIVNETKLLVLKTIGETLIDRFDESTDDVLQEVYFRVYKALRKNQFRGESKLSTWIYTIAKNESNRMNAKRLKEEEKAKKFLREGMFKEITDTAENDLDNTSLISHLLTKVPDMYQKPLLLYLEGKSMEEIAKELSVQPGTAKSRLFRAKSWIRENLLGEVAGEV